MLLSYTYLVVLKGNKGPIASVVANVLRGNGDHDGSYGSLFNGILRKINMEP